MFITMTLLMGLVIGSFLNVCICRLPKKESLVLPPSHCPACGHRLTVLDLIPVFSFLFLKGRCRYCQAAISPRYPVVELLTGLSFYAIAFYFGFTLEAVMGFTLLSGLIVCSLTDYDLHIIPDEVIVFLLIAAVPFLWLQSVDALLRGLLGLLVGGAVMLGLGLLFKDKLGAGDIKLVGVVGLYLGWQRSLLGLWLACLLACLAVTAMRCLGKKVPRRIPFGPFLSAGALLGLFFGAELIRFFFGGGLNFH
jgi:leader peptidase (prepilin peptidase)/N-methyltransferase